MQRAVSAAQDTCTASDQPRELSARGDLGDGARRLTDVGTDAKFDLIDAVCSRLALSSGEISIRKRPPLIPKACMRAEISLASERAAVARRAESWRAASW